MKDLKIILIDKEESSKIVEHSEYEEEIKVVIKQVTEEKPERVKTPSQINKPVFVMSPPLHAEFLPNNQWMIDYQNRGLNIKINIESYVYEWWSIYHILSNFGIVLTLPPTPGLQDLHFVNSFVYLPHIKDKDVCIISRFKAEGRQGEEAVVRQFLESMGYECHQPPLTYTFEGEHCLRWLRDDIYLGSFGVRTTKEALIWIEQNFNCKVLKLGLETPLCYDEHTEILTDSGWKYFKDLDGSELVATVNTETGEIEYQKPYEYIKIKYTGKVYHFKGKRMDLRVTADHKVFLSAKGERESLVDIKSYRFIEAKELNNSKDRFFAMKASALQKGDIPEKIQIADKEYDFRLFLKLIAWYITEGSCGKFVVKISQAKEEYRNEIKDILTTLEINFSEVEQGFFICDKHLIEFFGTACGMSSHDKRIPEFVKYCDYTLIREFILELIKGDGTYKSKRFDKRYNKEYNNYSMSFFTSSKQLADDVQELCVKCGWRAKKRLVYRVKLPKIKTNFEEFVVDIDFHKDYVTGRTKDNIIIEEVVDEIFYDVNVPKYHTLIVRRNGCVTISGNCYHGDCIIFPITPYDVIVGVKHADPIALKELEKYANIIPVEDEELLLGGVCNNIVVNGCLIAGDLALAVKYDLIPANIAKKVKDFLEKVSTEYALEPIFIPLIESLKQGGLLSCYAARLNWYDRYAFIFWKEGKDLVKSLV